MDVLKTLQECSFRGISFPVSAIIESFSHDLPQHKAVDRDGAFVENTGRNPFVFAVTALFVAASLARGKAETWNDLYPARFESFRTACLDRTTADFVHPLYGTFRVKASDWKSSLNADERGGQIVEVNFIETRDDNESPSFTPSDRARASSAAADLDAKLGTLNPPPPSNAMPDDGVSWSSIVNTILTQLNAKTLQAKRALATIDRNVAKLNILSNSINRSASVIVTDAQAGTTINLGFLGPGAGSIWTSCQVLRSALMDIRSSLAVNGTKTIATYTVPRPVMLVSLSMKLKNSTAEILALNPGLNRAAFTIPSNTIVQYYVR